MDILIAAALAFVAFFYASVPDAGPRSGEPTEDTQPVQPDEAPPGP